MKKLILFSLVFFVTLSSALIAQEQSKAKVHEIGINFSSLNQFGLHYKTGNEKTLFRIAMLTLDLGSQSSWGRDVDSIDEKQQSFGLGFRLGFERHVQIVKKLDFIWGLEAGCNGYYNHIKASAPYSDRETTQWRIMPMVNIILGATCRFADHFVVGAEITPGLHYSYGKTKSVYPTFENEVTNTGINFGFTNSFASLSLAYRFGK